MRAATAAMSLLIIVGIAAVSAGNRSPSIAATPPESLTINCRSPALGGTLPAAVYLPAGYRNGTARFPVIYFLHGLPAGPTAYKSAAFVARSVAAGENRAIVVAPQGARNANSDREYLNWGPRENWPAAVSGDLPRCIDKRFRTLANRRGRTLVGLSAGGFGAFNIGLRHLETFAAVESWSGYFAATDPTGLRTLDLGSEEANHDAQVPREDRLDANLEMRPTFIGFYVGQQDSRFLNANIRLDRAFSANHIAHSFEIYQGGHAESLWRKWAPLWLRLALEHLSRPRHVR